MGKQHLTSELHITIPQLFTSVIKCHTTTAQPASLLSKGCTSLLHGMWQPQVQAWIRASKQNYKLSNKEKSSSAASGGETATQGSRPGQDMKNTVCTYS